MEKITLINGNEQPMERTPPMIVIDGVYNDIAIKHVFENTGLQFIETHCKQMTAQPETFTQIAALFLTYNFKTKYYNNSDHKNTLFLRSDHNTGFDVRSICADCVKHNHIHIVGLKDDERLSC